MTVNYVIGRPFLGAGPVQYNTGEQAPDEVKSWPNLQSLVAAGFLYPYVADEEYSYLPPYLFSMVRSLQETRGIIELGGMPKMNVNWTKPDALQKSEDLVALEEESRERNKVNQEVAAQRRDKAYQAQLLSPRPIELPPEKFLVDSSKGKAEADLPVNQETGEELGSGMEHIPEPFPEPEGAEDLPDPVQQAEAADDAGVSDDDEDDDENYTKADLQELARDWNENHEDDKISLSTNKPELEEALSERGVI